MKLTTDQQLRAFEYEHALPSGSLPIGFDPEAESTNTEGVTMNNADKVAYFEDQAEMHQSDAVAALRRVISDAEQALAGINLVTNQVVHQTVGGSVLNRQQFDDAERALVRYVDACNAANVVRRED